MSRYKIKRMNFINPTDCEYLIVCKGKLKDTANNLPQAIKAVRTLIQQSKALNKEGEK